jgi:hypothetical protein
MLETLGAICAVIGNANSPMLFIIINIYQCVCDAESGARLNCYYIIHQCVIDQNGEDAATRRALIMFIGRNRNDAIRDGGCR